MDIDIEELKQDIKRDIEDGNKRFLIKALLYCYNYSNEVIQDAEQQFEVDRGEAVVGSGSFDEMFEQMQYELKDRGRQFVLVLIVGNMFQYFGTDKRHSILTMVEICEIDQRVEQDQYMEANLRLCSYLENLLKEKNEADDRNLYNRIQTTHDEGTFSKDQEKLAQFIRDVRNDAAHNFWLENRMEFCNPRICRNFVCYAASQSSD